MRVKVFTIIPAKPLAEGKTRLAGILGDEERIAFNRVLFDRTLDLAVTCPLLSGTIVTSRDPELIARARSRDVPGIQESAGAGLNGALDLAAQEAARRGADAVLVLPVDLPDLEATDIEAMILAAGPRPAMVIAPDRFGEGTNALLIAPPQPIAFAFGPASFAAHRAAAEQAGVVPAVIRRENLAFDVDTPDDHALMLARHRRRSEASTEAPG